MLEHTQTWGCAGTGAADGGWGAQTPGVHEDTEGAVQGCACTGCKQGAGAGQAAPHTEAGVPVQSSGAKALLYVVTGQQQDGA